MGILGAATAEREALEIVLPDRATIKRVTQTVTAGAWTDQPSDLVTGVPCRADADGATAREMIVAGRETGAAAYTILLSTVASRWPGGVVDVAKDDRIVVTGDAPGEYEVVNAAPVTDELVRTVRCTKVV